jgi:hypothetical protein
MMEEFGRRQLDQLDTFISKFKSPRTIPTLADALDINANTTDVNDCSLRREFMNSSNALEPVESSPPAEIELL